MIGRAIRHKDCEGLITTLQGLLNRWSSKKLSYVGWIKLVEWVFFGKFTHLIQSSIVPKKTIAKIQLIAYHFLWGNQRPFTWDDMAKTKEEGRVEYGLMRGFGLLGCTQGM